MNYKLAVSSTGKNLDDMVDRFGRCQYFIISEIENDVIKSYQSLPNKSLNQAGGAGISAAQDILMENPKELSYEKIFFPLLDKNGMDSRISEHFGHAPFFGLYDTKTKELEITENKLSHADSNQSPVDQIVDAVNPSTIFAKEMGSRAISLFAEKEIHVKTGNYIIVKEVIENLDELEDLTKSCGH